MDKPNRKRVNAKQKSNGEWYFDITCEGATCEDMETLVLTSALKTEKVFLAAGKKIVGG